MAENGCILAENETENDETVVSVQDYMKEVEERELHADLVLGGDQGEECTYSRGHLPRQAVFSCLTCTPTGNAGFCTACALTCHDAHTVVELWTKRNFRCDCGNPKFGGFECKLLKDKGSVNTKNSYNQNFLGLYCSCHRRYPEPEDADLGEMVQCCICEDWFHEKHLGLLPNEQLPRDAESDYAFEDVICPACLPRCSFLHYYKDLFIEPCSNQEEEDNSDQLSSPVEEALPSTGQPAVDSSINLAGDLRRVIEGPIEVDTLLKNSEPVGTANGTSQELKCLAITVNSAEFEGRKDQPCKLKYPVEALDQIAEEECGSGQTLETRRALFCREGWRNELCRCDSCQSIYRTKGLTFLLDEGDTLSEYEEHAKQKRKENQEQEADITKTFLHGLNRVQQIELLHGWNDMTSEFNSFLKEFEESQKTVTAADIHEFFETLTKKRRRLN